MQTSVPRHAAFITQSIQRMRRTSAFRSTSSSPSVLTASRPLTHSSHRENSELTSCLCCYSLLMHAEFLAQYGQQHWWTSTTASRFAGAFLPHSFAAPPPLPNLTLASSLSTLQAGQCTTSPSPWHTLLIAPLLRLMSQDLPP